MFVAKFKFFDCLLLFDHSLPVSMVVSSDWLLPLYFTFPVTK